MNWARLQRTVEAAEDRRHSPYKCSAGKLTIGIGHNLDDRPISNAVIDLMFREDMELALQDAKRIVESFSELTPRRQECLVEMAFQLGAVRMLTFGRMLAAIDAGDHDATADEMLDSKWAKRDTPSRAERIAFTYREG